MKGLLFTTTLVLLLGIGAVVMGQVPAVLPFQAVITDNGGDLLAPDTEVTFSIYTAETAGSRVWGPEIHSVTPDAAGVVSVYLGAGDTPVPVTAAVFPATADRWLAIEVAGEELSRIRLGSTPFAFNAARLAGLASTAFAAASHTHNHNQITDAVGISQGIGKGINVVIDQTTMEDVITTTLTIPAAGYVLVEASAQARISGTTLANYFAIQIDKTAGGGVDGAYYYNVGGTFPSTASYWFPVSIRRTYLESAAGTYTYRLEALASNADGNKNMWNPTITATYIPKSYGTVSYVVGPEEAGEFDSAEAVTIGNNGDGAGGQTAYLVDLRDLELRAERARADAERAERELLEAKQDR